MMADADKGGGAVTTRWKYYRMDPKAFMQMGILKVRASLYIHGVPATPLSLSCRASPSPFSLLPLSDLIALIPPSLSLPLALSALSSQVRFFMEFLRAGFDLLCSDLDVVWLRDPRPLLIGEAGTALLPLADVRRAGGTPPNPSEIRDRDLPLRHPSRRL